jgi:hypothetical protein
MAIETVKEKLNKAKWALAEMRDQEQPCRIIQCRIAIAPCLSFGAEALR